MPIYEYKCLKCGHQFEQLQKINSEDLTICPECQAPKLQRLISNTSFQLKGSGWYVTDYKKGNSAAGSTSSPSSKKPKEDKKTPEKTDADSKK